MPVCFTRWFSSYSFVSRGRSDERRESAMLGKWTIGVAYLGYENGVQAYRRPSVSRRVACAVRGT